MSKSNRSAQTEAAAAEPAEIPAEIPAPQPAQPTPAWTENRWSGLSHFNCNGCAFETLEREEIVAHVARQHSNQVPAGGQHVTSTHETEE